MEKINNQEIKELLFELQCVDNSFIDSNDFKFFDDTPAFKINKLAEKARFRIIELEEEVEELDDILSDSQYEDNTR